MRTVEGILRDGKIELLAPLDAPEGQRVTVTPVGAPTAVDLRERGIDLDQAADLRRRLATFAEDWNRPEMSIYDDLPSR